MAEKRKQTRAFFVFRPARNSRYTLRGLASQDLQGLTQRFAQQTGVCPGRFSRLRCGGRLFQQVL